MSLFDFLKKRKTRSSRPRGEPKISGSGERSSTPKSEAGWEPSRPLRGRKKSSAGSFARSWLVRKAIKLGMYAFAILAVFTFYLYLTLPDVSTLAEIKKTPSITIKAEDGKVIGSYGDVYGDYIPFSRMPQNLINAVVATEDRNFFHHHGIDPVGLLRAGVADIRARHVVQGGSTITQQLAKNIFLTPERTIKRKIQEVLLALELERRYSKQEILSIYLNRVYMGAGNYGMDSASKRYFGHSVRDTSLAEDAILVGLLKAPSRYAPTNNPDLSEKRATQVLINMKEAGYLTDAQLKVAKRSFNGEETGYRDNHSFGAFYFSDFVVSLIPQSLTESKEDLVITTTLRPDWQAVAEDAVNKVLESRGKALNASQAALLSMTPDGAIRAMVGGRNYRASQFNRVTQALRQPGSSFKLFVYLAGLEAGYLPDSEMVDQPVDIGKWHPKDYTGQYLGRITLRQAFAESINSIAIQLSEAVGRDKVIDMARRLGISTKMEADPSIALGTNEVTLFDITKAYAHLAAGGMRVEPYAITRIETVDGKLLYNRDAPPPPVEVLRGSTVNMMNDLLLAVTTVGTGRGAQIGRPVAGKTGTTSDYRDAWFMGFTPQVVTGVWVGNDDTTSMKKVTGGSLPASIWHEYMAGVMRNFPIADIPFQTGPSIIDNLTAPLFQPPVTQAPPGAQVPAAQTQPGIPAGMQTPQVPAENMQAPQTQPGVPAQQPPPALGGLIPTQAPAPVYQVTPLTPAAPEPEEQQEPEYNAPPSFWDKLMGDDKSDNN